MNLQESQAHRLVEVRQEIDQLDNDIADLLMRRLAKARFARYLHPEYVDDHDRQFEVLSHYYKRLTPWTSKSTVYDFCTALFRMSRP